MADYARIPASAFRGFGRRWQASAGSIGATGYGETKPAALAALAETIERMARQSRDRRYVVCHDGTVLVVQEGWYDIVHRDARVSGVSTGDTLAETLEAARRHARQSYGGFVGDEETADDPSRA